MDHIKASVLTPVQSKLWCLEPRWVGCANWCLLWPETVLFVSTCRDSSFMQTQQRGVMQSQTVWLSSFIAFIFRYRTKLDLNRKTSLYVFLSQRLVYHSAQILSSYISTIMNTESFISSRSWAPSNILFCLSTSKNHFLWTIQITFVSIL